MPKLLMLGHEAVGSTMSGPAIRNWEMARVLAAEFPVVLAVPQAGGLQPEEFRLVEHSDNAATIRELAADADVILVSGYSVLKYPELARLGRRLIADVYDPYPIENLSLRCNQSLQQRTALSEMDFSTLKYLLRAGAFFICGNERQRDFYLGMLSSAGRLTPGAFQDDPNFRQLIDVVSMGIPAVPPEMPVPARSREHGLSREDFIVVWPGGVWDWLDPLTAVEAIGLLRQAAPDVKLLFPGLQHPSPEIAANMTVPAAVTRRATELGLLGTQVIAGEWVPYLERARYLLGADLAVSLNHDTLESRFAIRSRLLDCIWASLPVVATEGDAIVEHMVAHGVASTVPADEPAALAEAILAWRRRLRSGDELGSRFAALAPRYYWSNVCQPLINYLRRLEAEDNELRRLQVRMPVCRKLRQEELISLPFDQYQRHRRAAELVNVLQNAGDERINLLDVGGGPGILRSFIGEASRVVSYDLAVQPGAASVTGDASSMPFADGCFDFVVSLDTLEHLPAERRSLMIEECIRVSRRGVVLSCPFSSEEANQAERLLHSFHNMALAREQHQLLEHIKNGLPRRDWLEGYLQQAGWRFAAGPSGQVHRWLAMMLAKHYLMTMPNSETLHRELDEAYNRRYYEADQVAPSYRWTYFISKLGQQGDLDTATSVLAGGLSAAAALQPLAQDNMLRLIELMATDLENGAPSLLTNAVRGAADRHRHIANLEEAISVKDEYIADLRSHLTKIERGRLMRLLNRFRSLRGASD